MADDTDISGMPDPSAIGLVDTSEMPDPTTIGLAPKSDTHFYGTPDPNAMTGTEERGKLLKRVGSELTGLPRAAASAALSVPAGVASVAGQASGALGAALDPTNATNYLEQGNARGRDWAAKVNKLADYVPATKEGAEFSNQLMSLPAGVAKETVGSAIQNTLGDNAYQTAAEIAQDVGTDLPAFGAPSAVRGVVKGAKATASAARAAAASEAATATAPAGTAYDTAGAIPPSPKIAPPVGKPISADDLRAQPNPIPPPEGTVAAARQAAQPPTAAPEPPAATPSPAPAQEPAAQTPPNAAPGQRGSFSFQNDNDLNNATAAPRAKQAGVPGERNPRTEYNANNQLAGGRELTPEQQEVLRRLSGQRGSVRLFDSPADEGPQETPQPEQQAERAAHLDAIDKLSGGGLPSRRTSALTGDYNATGDDWQMKEVGNEPMRQQIASENAALHSAAENVHDSVGSQFANSVDSTTLGDRGRVTRGAIQAIEKHFDDATDGLYNTARATVGNNPIPKLQRVHDYLNDDSNFTNDAEIGLQRAAKQRLDRLWSTGDPAKNTPAGSVAAAERFREFINEKYSPQNGGVSKALKNATDMDVAEHGGPGLFQAARAMRQHSAQMLEEPAGIRKLLTPTDSQGINHAIPEHKVMDYIADLPREQHAQVLNVLKAGAHLTPELAKSSADAIREIQAHTISRIHAAATNADGSWNARKFYNAADRYARNMPDTFKDRPDVVSNLKTINDAGNTLHMDKHYPGAAAQTERTGAIGHALETGGKLASGIAHEIPFGGRMVGRAIEHGVEKATGKMSETARDKAVMQRLVDRNGKQRGSVMPFANEDEGSMLNVGLHQGQEGQPGFRKMSKQEATGAVESTGAKVTKSSVLTPEAHGVPEPTLVASTNRPLSEPEMQKVLAKTKQSAIPQRTDAGVESMHVAPGHEAIAKAEGWDKFNPDYFRDHAGSVKPPSGQRGSFSFQNDNELNRATSAPRSKQSGAGIEPRNERNERTANQQLGGARPLTPEQQEVMRRLSGQRGSVRVMNEKPLEGAPEGDRPNGKARAAAAAYAKSAGIDYKPLEDYRYVDPKVAKSVADAYDEMKHDPTNPKVAKSYDAFKAETLAQYKQMQKAGVKVDLDPSYPYKNPREMHEDVRANNHMSIYPTEAGFGSGEAAASDHPLMEKAPVKMGGKDATYNDLFRAVHDYYGHAAEGNGFRANGEYNAWRAHRQMYSDAARGAMDAETLGQNSWVNSGPAAALNKGASGADTIYADQKAGLLPPKVVKSAEEGVGADEHHITNQLTDAERNQLRADTTKRLVDAFHSAPATKEYAAAALAGAAKRGWYRNSAQAIVNQFGTDAPRFAGLLSAMSPQVSVQTNFANALKTFVNWDKEGRPEDPGEIRRIMEQSSQKSASAAPGSSNVLDAWVNNSVRALTADDPSNIKLSGPKVHSFYNNLTDNVHEVTNDAWMAAFSKTDPAKLGGGLTKTGPGKSPSYLALSAKVRDAARMISHLTGETWTPAEVQETVWSWAKTAYEHAEEKGDRSIPDLVKNGDITDELIKSTPDFHQLFGTSEHRGLLQSSSFADNATGVDDWQKPGAVTAGASKAREAAQAALRPHLLSAAERLESLRQERRAAGKSVPKSEE